MKNKIVRYILPIGLLVLSTIFRLYGLRSHAPFWVDEFSTVNQVEILLTHKLSILTDRTVYFEFTKIVPTVLAAASFLILGSSVLAAKLPFVLLGSLFPLLVYFFAKRFLDTTTAVGAALLTICSYFLITWSLQARSYIIIVFLVVALFYQYLLFLEKRGTQIARILLFTITLLLGICTHPFFYIAVICIGLHFAWYSSPFFKTLLSKFLLFIVCIIGAGIVIMRMGGLHNNLWYYHGYLWQNYSLIVFLGLVGLVIGLIQYKKIASLFLLYCLLHFLFITYIFGAYTSRYTLPLFPFLFIGVSYALTHIVKLVTQNTTAKKYAGLIALFLIIFIISNGDKFVTKPKQFYSVDHDFRDIALIDYDQVYNIIKTKGELPEGKTAVIDTWPDRLNWYLGDNFKPAFVFRWGKLAGMTNGLPRATEYVMNNANEKVLPTRRNIRLITDVKDLKMVMNTYPKGFLFIDDSTLPHDVIDYANKNLKKEIYLDHYPLDDNPYSIWPATLYSWGM